MRLKDQVAVVTGGGSGIGRGIARMFAREGAKVVIAGRTESRLAEVQKEIGEEGGESLAVPTDVGQEGEVKALMEATQARFGGLDVLVNNAGIGMNVPIDELDMADYDRAMDTNLRGMFLCCRYGVPLIKEQGAGSIITIASVHGVQGRGRDSVYAATKGGIIAGTRGFAVELAPFGIRANVISPGAISVRSGGPPRPKGLSDEDWEEYVRLFGDRLMDRHRFFQPVEVVGLPKDIAYCAVYLASAESRFVTGQNIVVDGGLTSTLSPFAPEGSREKAQASAAEIRAWLDAHTSEVGRS